MNPPRKTPQLDSDQIQALKVWTAIMPDYMKMLREVHAVLIGRMDTPTPTPGMIEQMRDMQTKIGELQGDMAALKEAYEKDAAQTAIARIRDDARLANLERHDIARFIKENKKLSTMVIMTVLLILAPPDLREPLLVWLQNQWMNIVGP